MGFFSLKKRDQIRLQNPELLFFFLSPLFFWSKNNPLLELTAVSFVLQLSVFSSVVPGKGGTQVQISIYCYLQSQELILIKQVCLTVAVGNREEGAPWERFMPFTLSCFIFSNSSFLKYNSHPTCLTWPLTSTCNPHSYKHKAPAHSHLAETVHS